jgi:MFS family permease
LFGVVALVALPAGLPRSEESSGFGQNWRILRDDARLRRVLGASLLIGLVFVQVFSTMSLAITQNGFSAATYGAVISLNGALVVLFELPLASITRRYPPLPVIALGFVLIGLGFASNALERTIPLLVMTTAVFTLGEMVAMPVSAAYVANLAPADQRGMYMGLYGLVWSVAFVAGPSVGMALFSVNPTALWVSCGVFGVLSSALILGGARAAQRVPCLRTVPSELP